MGNDAALAKPIPLPYSIIMRKKLIFIYLSSLLFLTACENTPFNLAETQPITSLTSEQSVLDSKEVLLVQRKKQQAVIETTFRLRTSPMRAQQLAELCFEKTSGTPFMPFDLAEIALAESGGHRLSARAVSTKGARGVWQLMPERAKSHGFSTKDMLDDEKCATAAVCELYTKLEMAHGNLELAKKYYCGQGPQANAYLKKIRIIRHEMMTKLVLENDKLALAEINSVIR